MPYNVVPYIYMYIEKHIIIVHRPLNPVDIDIQEV